MMLDLPPLSAFLRPIGVHRYYYCLRVMQQFRPEKDLPGIEYERWGLKDGRPFDDGHVMRGYFIDLAPALISGVWRLPAPDPADYFDRDSYRWATPSNHLWETYYRLMPTDQHGQQELFA